MSELPLEDVPDVSDAVHEAAGGRVVHITEHGQRLAAIVPVSVIEALRAAEDAEDAAEADAAWDEPGEPIPLEDLEAEFGR
ncbi:MAG: prevent-host-death protein [Actinomycetota bacterium]|nr:prevent-host-death protein [Actinomycetota bacterium]